MATYLELDGLRDTASLSDLRRKIDIAIMIRANGLAKSSPTAAQAAFAKSALTNPLTYRESILNYVLADYNTATVGAISGATDAQVQSAVNAAIDTLLVL